MPKIYFYDTGLASALLGVQNSQQLDLHPFKGSLFENMVIVELLKNRFNQGKSNNLFFWRDNNGNEVDVILENGVQLFPIEIKSGQTIQDDYFKGIHYWNKILQQSNGYLIYGGKEFQMRSNGIEVIPVNEINRIEM